MQHTLINDINNHGINPVDFVWRVAPNGSGITFICQLNSRKYMLTNVFGSVIWNAITENEDLTDVINTLSAKYEIPVEQVTNDTRQFLCKMKDLINSFENPSAETTTVTKGEFGEFILPGLMELWHGFPNFAQISLTENCNFHCKHCYIHQSTQNLVSMKYDEIKHVLLSLASIGVYALTLSGGELFTRSDICSVFKLCRRLGFKVTVMTNASLINEIHLKSMKDYNISRCVSTLYGASENSYYDFTGHSCFSNVFNTLKKLNDYGIELELNIIATKYNYNEVSSMIAIGRELDASINFTTEILPARDGSIDPLHCQIPEGDCLAKLTKDNWVRQGRQLNDSLFLCSAGVSSLSIEANGDVQPCPTHPDIAGNMFSTPLNEIWAKAPVFHRIRRASIEQLHCYGCSNIPFCSANTHCWAAALLLTGDENSISSRRCFLAKAIKDEYSSSCVT